MHVTKPRTLLVVAGVLINAQNEVLIAKRPPGKMLAGHWEFPGGKVEPDESPEAALVRELQEELGITVREADLASFWFLSHPYPQFHLLLPVWTIRRWQGEPAALEHDAIAWKTPAQMRALPMIEADDPLVARLEALLS